MMLVMHCTLYNRWSTEVLMYKGKVRLSNRSTGNRYLEKDEFETFRYCAEVW